MVFTDFWLITRSVYIGETTNTTSPISRAFGAAGGKPSFGGFPDMTGPIYEPEISENHYSRLVNSASDLIVLPLANF